MGASKAIWKTAWVTGASTGIGRELVLRLAREGIRVAASARSVDKLTELASLHSNITAVPVDVTLAADLIAAHAHITSSLGPIDLAILNAGVWEPMDAGTYDAARISHSMAVNYGGIVNALQPLIPAMMARGTGQIALVASVAGYRGLPKAIAYAPSKAAVISLAEVLRLELAPHGITLCVVNPGFVKTPMTAVNDFSMPYMVTADFAANAILAGLRQGRFEIAFPWQLVATLKLLRVLPYPLYFRIARRLTAG